jgi:hypothetical protein
MENISGVVRHLRKELEKELERAKNEVERYAAALVALGSKSGARRGSGQRRPLSVAARRKISLAQKARWAKQNGQTEATRAKRPVSAGARRKMAAAQRARWANVKGQKKAA